MTFKSVIRKDAKRHVLSDQELDAIKGAMKVDDVRSEVLTAGGGCLWGQFWAHGALDSMGTGQDLQNRYTGEFDGSDGVYPRRGKGGAPVMDAKGWFILPNNDLPTVNTGATAQLVPDNHRGNENTWLKAHHLWFARFHNRRMDENGGDYEAAKMDTLASACILFANETKHMAQISDKELYAVTVKDFHLSPEWVMAVARLQHPGTSDEIEGEDIFVKKLASEVNLPALYDGSNMARNINFGVGTRMANMDHIPNSPDIRDLTTARHSAHDLANVGELARAFRVSLHSDVNPDWPIWHGLLMETELQGDGFLGELSGKAFCAGIGGSIPMAVRKHGRWDGAPNATQDIIEYGWQYTPAAEV